MTPALSFKVVDRVERLTWRMESVPVFLDENASWNLNHQMLQTQNLTSDQNDCAIMAYNVNGEDFIPSSFPMVKAVNEQSACQHPTAALTTKQRKRSRRKGKPSDNGEQEVQQPQQQRHIPLFQKKFLLESAFFLNDERTSCVSVAFQPSQNFQQCMIFSSNKNVIALDPVLVNDLLNVCDQVNHAVLSNKSYQVALSDQRTFIGVKRMFSNLYVWIAQDKHRVSLTLLAWIRFNEYLPAIRKCIAAYAISVEDVRILAHNLAQGTDVKYSSNNCINMCQLMEEMFL